MESCPTAGHLPRPFPDTIRGCAAVAVMVLGAACVPPPAMAQGTYDEQPLRGNVADLPFANTSLGRENARFASHAVNRYRLYDYYKRQARWHLENPTAAPPFLLPFPGLDGGRRGHWGVTNEPSVQALKRSTAPAFPEVLARGEYGLLHLSFPACPFPEGRKPP